MSSILRMLRFIPRVAVARHTQCLRQPTAVALQTRLYSQPAPLESEAAVSGRELQRARRRQRASIEHRPNETGDALRSVLLEMEAAVGRTGRISLVAVEDAIRVAQSKEENLTPSQIGQLLRATGAFLRECSAEKRAALTDVVWELGKSLKLDISHYNTLLQVRLENEVNFDPQSFLVELKEAGIIPNRVTFQRLIQRFCDMGDIAGATKVLEFMKSEQMPVSERVFNALITGNLRAGDPDSARKVLEVMSGAGLSPTAETNTVLACGLAAKGDTAAAIATIAGQDLSPEQTLRVVKATALAGSISDVENVLQLVKPVVGVTQDLVNTCLELLTLKKLEAAVAVFERLPNQGYNTGSGNFFISQMVRSGLPMKDVVQFCRNLKDSGLNDTGILTAVERALYTCNRETTLEYLRLLPEQGFPLRTHYFYPVVCKATNQDEVYDTLRHMVELETSITEDILSEFVLPRVDIAHPNEVLDRLTKLGCPALTASTAITKALLRSSVPMKECLQFLNDCSGIMNGGTLAAHLGVRATVDEMKTCVAVLKKLMELSVLQPNEDLAGRFLSKVPKPALSAAALEIANEKLSIGVRAFESLKRQGAPVSQLSPYVVRDHIVSAMARNVTDLEERPQVDLLRAYARARNAEKTEEILENITERDLSPYTCATLIDIKLQSGDLEGALQLYRRALQTDGFKIDQYKVVNIAASLIENGRMAEAKQLLDSYTFETQKEQLHKNARRLVQASIGHSSVEETFEIIDKYITKFTDVNKFVLSPVVGHFLDNGDVNGAVEQFKNVFDRYGVAACKRELFLRLMADRKDSELAELLELAKRIYGDTNACIDQIVYYLESGRISDAQEMAKNYIEPRSHQKVASMMELLVDSKQIEILEKFVELVRDHGLNNETIYYYLIRGYSRVDKIDKAFEQWMKAQEDNIVLSDRTLRYLGHVLERAGHTVPFVLPSEFESGNQSTFRTVLAKSVDQALKMRSELQAKNEHLTMIDESLLLSTLAERKQIDKVFPILKELFERALTTNEYPEGKAIRFALSRMARLGNVDEIATLRSLVKRDSLVKSFGLDDALCNAYVFAGRASECLDILEKMPNTNAIGLQWIHNVLENCPEALDRVLEISKRIAKETETTSVISVLWTRLFMERNFEKADAILAEFPQILERGLRVNRVLSRIRETHDEDMAQRLLTILKGTNHKRIYAVALSVHLDVLLEAGRVDEAHKHLSSACAEGLDIGLCNIKTLENLKKELFLVGQEVDFTLPSKKTDS